MLPHPVLFLSQLTHWSFSWCKVRRESEEEVTPETLPVSSTEILSCSTTNYQPDTQPLAPELKGTYSRFSLSALGTSPSSLSLLPRRTPNCALKGTSRDTTQRWLHPEKYSCWYCPPSLLRPCHISVAWMRSARVVERLLKICLWKSECVGMGSHFGTSTSLHLGTQKNLYI